MPYDRALLPIEFSLRGLAVGRWWPPGTGFTLVAAQIEWVPIPDAPDGVVPEWTADMACELRAVGLFEDDPMPPLRILRRVHLAAEHCGRRAPEGSVFVVCLDTAMGGYNLRGQVSVEGLREFAAHVPVVVHPLWWAAHGVPEPLDEGLWAPARAWLGRQGQLPSVDDARGAAGRTERP